MVRCAIPAVCDGLSHLFNEEEHLATVHAVYGSNHLQAEVAGEVTENHSCKHTASLQQNEPNLIHIFTQGYSCCLHNNVLITSYFDSACSLLLYQSSDIIIPPPENC